MALLMALLQTAADSDKQVCKAPTLRFLSGFPERASVLTISFLGLQHVEILLTVQSASSSVEEFSLR